MVDFDLVTVGGGLAGSSLAKATAERGVRVLVLEQETKFRDRVRGEGLVPWGAAEARTLGIDAPLIANGAKQVSGWTNYRGSQTRRRDLPSTTPSGRGLLDWFHPAMQETLLGVACDAGAEVRRGGSVVRVTPGPLPRVLVQNDGKTEEVTARLVVGADGRNSKVREWAGFEILRDRPFVLIAGLLFEGMDIPADSAHNFVPTTFGEHALVLPQGGGRARVYVMTARRAERGRLSGPNRVRDFIDACLECGVPAEWFADATPHGPLASFEAASNWVEHPYRDGVVLIGDAAASPNPSFGQGQSLTLRDVRVLSELLGIEGDWEAAADQYAMMHDKAFGVVHTVEGWMTRINFTTGPEGDRIREHAMPVLQQGLGPDLIANGPETHADDAARVQLFGS